jgi:hypothetical protein
LAEKVAGLEESGHFDFRSHLLAHTFNEGTKLQPKAKAKPKAESELPTLGAC